GEGETAENDPPEPAHRRITQPGVEERLRYIPGSSRENVGANADIREPGHVGDEIRRHPRNGAYDEERLTAPSIDPVFECVPADLPDELLDRALAKCPGDEEGHDRAGHLTDEIQHHPPK